MMKYQLNNKIKIFIFDIGKTLFDKSKQKRCSDEIIKALTYLKANNYKIGVCTMRTVNYIKEIIPIDFDFYILNNGAYVEVEKNIIVNIPLSEFKIFDRDYLTYNPFLSMYSTFEAKTNADYNGFIVDAIGIIKNPYNVILFDKTYKDIDALKNKYNVYYWENTKTLSIQNKNTSRILGCKAVLNFYKFKKDECLYFGDGPNDLEVFKELPYGIAMNDCFPLLLKYSYLQIGTCNDNAVAKFIFDNF